VHAACAVAVPLDLGDGIPPGARLGIFAPVDGNRRQPDDGPKRGYQRAGGVAPPHRRAREEPRSRAQKKQRADGRLIVELLLILIYVSICWAIFKIFRIPVNQWSLATATLGGIIGIAIILLVMNYNHPFTTNVRIYFAVTPVLPAVSGRVIEVPVQANMPLKEGDVLFRIDPKPYQYIVDQRRAALAEAEQNVQQLKASLDQATANAERANAQLTLAQQNYDRQFELYQKNIIAPAALDTYTRNLETARQSLAGAKAQEERARLAYMSNLNGVN